MRSIGYHHLLSSYWLVLWRSVGEQFLMRPVSSDAGRSHKTGIPSRRLGILFRMVSVDSLRVA